MQYALSQVFVVSSTDAHLQNQPRGVAGYYDMLGADSFGNFRQLLQDVTLSPIMGQFLSMLGNDKGNATTDPDENYAREVMQLFTIGLYELNNDGSRKLDGSGNPIPTYSNNDVMGLAKVFTGFSWQVPGDTSDTAWSKLLHLRRHRRRRRSAAHGELCRAITPPRRKISSACQFRLRPPPIQTAI